MANSRGWLRARAGHPQGVPLHGLRANWQQFALLVVVNGFVGALVGLERTVIPLIADVEFGLQSHSAILSFLVSFGLVKAFTNLFAGALGDRIGRRRVLVAGWLIGLPVPLLIIVAPTWGWIVFANVLLGINQGLCWSTTVIMKIDLVGPQRRGLAMGLNEFAGYVAVSLSALLTGYLAAAYGLRVAPFVPGFGFAAAGLVLSLLFVGETHGFARSEAALYRGGQVAGTHHSQDTLSFRRVFLLASWREPSLFAASQAGLVNNLNDGLVWGLVPLFLAGAGLPVAGIGLVAATYPAVWGVGQLVTGPLSDHWGRKPLIVAGMLVQAIGLALFGVAGSQPGWLAAAAMLGVGTAMVYPTLLAAVSDLAHPSWRGTAVGVYRLWRDMGFAIGGLAAGLLADAFSPLAALGAVAALTAFSGVVVAFRMRETLRQPEVSVWGGITSIICRTRD